MKMNIISNIIVINEPVDIHSFILKLTEAPVAERWKKSKYRPGGVLEFSHRIKLNYIGINVGPSIKKNNMISQNKVYLALEYLIFLLRFIQSDIERIVSEEKLGKDILSILKNNLEKIEENKLFPNRFKLILKSKSILKTLDTADSAYIANSYQNILAALESIAAGISDKKCYKETNDTIGRFIKESTIFISIILAIILYKEHGSANIYFNIN